MGNFLTTLGSEPVDDRAMFEELGLNTARQAHNGANPRPGQPPGWLGGETPPTPIDRLVDRRAEALLWDPATQLRHRWKSSVPCGRRMGPRTAGPHGCRRSQAGPGDAGGLATRGGDGLSETSRNAFRSFAMTGCIAGCD